MSQMTPSQARVIDPLVTAVARGYESPESAVANVLFPIVQVGQRAGTIMVFGKEQFDIVDTKRAPGASTKRSQFAYGSDKFSLIDYRLEAMVPYEIQEESAAVPGINLIEMSIRKVQDQMALERENEAALLARNAANYAASNKTVLSGTDLWTSAASNPFVVVEAGKEAIRKKIGKRPNVLMLPPVVLSALRIHPMVLDKISTSTDRTPATIAQLQAMFEVAMIVEGTAIYNGATGFSDVWGNDAILAYVSPKSMQEMGSQSFGYTYQLIGRPSVEEGYDDRNRNSWIVPYTDARAPVLVGANGGFLIQNAVAP